MAVQTVESQRGRPANAQHRGERLSVFDAEAELRRWCASLDLRFGRGYDSGIHAHENRAALAFGGRDVRKRLDLRCVIDDNVPDAGAHAQRQLSLALRATVQETTRGRHARLQDGLEFAFGTDVDQQALRVRDTRDRLQQQGLTRIRHLAPPDRIGGKRADEASHLRAQERLIDHEQRGTERLSELSEVTIGRRTGADGRFCVIERLFGVVAFHIMLYSSPWQSQPSIANLCYAKFSL